MTDALLKGAILSQFLKNLAEAVLQMGFRIVTLIFMFKCELRVDYFVIMLYHNKVSGDSRTGLHRQSDRNEEVISEC